MDNEPGPVLRAAIAAGLFVFAVGSVLLGFEATKLVGSPWRWALDVVAILLPSAVAWASRRFELPKMQLLTFILWPACFGCAGGATMRLAAEWFVPANPVIAVVGWTASVLGAWGCQAIALRAALTGSGLGSSVKESVLSVAVRQGPWALGMVGAFGSVIELVVLVHHPSWIEAALTSVLAATIFSYLGTLAGTALFSMVSGPEPEALRVSLRDLAALTGISFSRVIYLDSTLASGTLCEVRPDWRGHALTINRWTFDVLSADERLAVLAHEAGHLRQHYLGKQLAVNGICAAACVLAFVSVNNVLHLRGLAWVGVAALSTVLNWMMQAAFRRWLERDADRYATLVVGVAPVLGALAKLSPPLPIPSGLLSHYDSFDVRAARIRSVWP
jgi:Zn-dependent protease with chaperone function